jgi:hypothetical protein
MKTIVLKLMVTLVAISLWRYLNVSVNALATAESGIAAVKQFDDSVGSYVGSMTAIEYFKNLSGGFSHVFLFLAIISIWWSNLKSLFSNSKNTIPVVFAIILASFFTIPDDANAYYSRQDWSENINVLPNHSAFMIPAVGESKDSQKQFESEAFLNEKKVGAKRINIPHVILKNSGTFDYYVPGAILIMLDRTPYVVNWTKEANADSPTNQEVCVESEDSIQVCFDVSIGANVTEEDAAKYLYWFGVEPATGNDDERNFPSVLRGKSLNNVMNTRVHSRIKSAYFTEFAKYDFKTMLAKKGEILTTVEKNMIAEYKKMGITIEYIGISSDLRLDSRLQTSITDLIISQYTKDSAANRLEAAKTDRFIAETTVIAAQAEPYKKWNGQLPSFPQFMISSDKISDWIKSIADAVKN